VCWNVQRVQIEEPLPRCIVEIFIVLVTFLEHPELLKIISLHLVSVVFQFKNKSVLLDVCHWIPRIPDLQQHDWRITV